MADCELNLEDYSIYSHLSDEELIQIAVERSLSEKHPEPLCDQCLSSPSAPPPPSSSSSAPPPSSAPSASPPPSSSAAPGLPAEPATAPKNPNVGQRCPNPSRRLRQAPPPAGVQNCANPPTALSQFLYKAFKRDPLQSLIMNGDTEALMDWVTQRPGSLEEPNSEGWFALHEAAYYGQLQCVRILIRADPSSVNKCTLKKQTPLLLAASQGNASCVEFLLKHGADPNIANKDRDTALFSACENPNEAVVDLLLKAGARVNHSCSQGLSAFHEACRQGRLRLCRMLLEAGADLNTKNIYNIQPFFTAAQHGHTDLLRLLAQKGADINGQAGDGATPLYEACKNGHVPAVQALLSLKADANRATKAGLLPLHVAVKNNHTRIVSLLIPVTSRGQIHNSGISPLHIAAERNRDEIMELLIESGFNVNAVLSEERSRMYEDRRSTPLYFSVYNGNLEAAEMLLEAGANPNLDVFNPLLIAARRDSMDMAQLLLQYGADVNAQISTQPCSFPSAIWLTMESLPMLKLMLNYGCDARPCFDCPYGQKPHPPFTPPRRPAEEQPQGYIQFCQAVSSPSFCRLAGPVISLLLDYVSHVRLCSRLLEVLESCSNWMPIKQKALPPHSLMQLCRLKIRHLVGVQRLKQLCSLPLPVRVIRFLHYDVECSLS